MTGKTKQLRLGTRRSQLALWQSNFVKAALERAHPGLKVDLVEINTKGDQSQASGAPLPEIGGKGLFTAELEAALAKHEIDLAVHSIKDLPTKGPEEYSIIAVPQRGPVEDILISREQVGFWELPDGALIGTSSLRRSSQIRRLRSELRTESIRGNVDTRISKVLSSDKRSYDAVVLAQAGVERLGYFSQASYIFAVDEILPAAGQGALAIQALSARAELRQLCAVMHHVETAICVECERNFLSELGGGCNVPVAAYAKVQGRSISFIGRCISPDGIRAVEVSGSSAMQPESDLGRRMAEKALTQGAGQILNS